MYRTVKFRQSCLLHSQQFILSFPHQTCTTTYIELINGYYGNWIRVPTELLDKGEPIDVPQYTSLVLQ